MNKSQQATIEFLLSGKESLLSQLQDKAKELENWLDAIEMRLKETNENE